jgi:hypothetical protein
MRVILRPGHGLTPPATPTIDYSYCEDGYRHWLLQRPGNREDDYVAEFCGRYLIPALRRAGHCVDAMRAIDPSTGDLDTTPTTVGPETLPALRPGQGVTEPRWRYCAAVEGALRGVQACRTWAGESWSFDPVAACRWEAGIPSSSDDEVYLSIHQNWWSSPTVYGPAVLYCKGSRIGQELATSTYDAIAKTFAGDQWAEETRYRWGAGRSEYRIETGSRWGLYQSRLWELRYTRRLAVLVELAFASNPDDAQRMQDPGWCHRMAEGIAAGLG